MTNISITDQQPISTDPQVNGSPTVLQTFGDIAITFGLGSLAGYGVYWASRLIDKSGILNSVSLGFKARNCILVGVGISAVIHGIHIVSTVVPKVLGDRQNYEHLVIDVNTNQLDKFRHRTWKCVGRTDKFFQDHPKIVYTIEVAKNLLIGAGVGYILYGFTKILDKYQLLGEVDSRLVTPIPYVLSGVTSVAITETTKIIYKVALHLLKDRQVYENLADVKGASKADKLRHYSWKVISHVEKVPLKVDLAYSNLFKIRTEKQMREMNVEMEKDPRFMEVVRRAFLDQCTESFQTAVPQELGVYLVEALGYTVIGGHLFVWLHAINFAGGLINKIGEVYQKNEKYERELMRQQAKEAENKVYCDILNDLWPNEIDALDKTERDVEALSESIPQSEIEINQLDQIEIESALENENTDADEIDDNEEEIELDDLCKCFEDNDENLLMAVCE